MEPDTDMDYYDDEGGLPSVDDLTVVAEIAEAELRQLEKIQAAGARARELRQRLESKQRNTGAEEAAHKNCEDGTPAAKKGGDANDMEGSGDEEPDSEKDACDSTPESDGGDTFQNLEDVMKEMQAKKVEPDSPPVGPLHGLGELTELPAELDVTVKDTDKLTHIGRVTSIVDGIVVVKGLENSAPMDTGSVLCGEDRAVIGLVEDVFGQVTQPNYAVRPCGSCPATMPEVGAKVMAVSSLIVRVDLGTARNVPAIDFEEGEEDPEDLDSDEMDGDGAKTPDVDAASKSASEGNSRKDARQGTKKKKKPVAAAFQGVSGVDNAEDALKALGPADTGVREQGGRGCGRGRGRGREGGGRSAGGRRPGGGGVGGRQSGGRRRDSGMAGAAGASHRPQMQSAPPVMPGAISMMFTTAGPAGMAGAMMGAVRPPPQAMHAVVGMQPGMPLMFIPTGYMHAGGGVVEDGMGAPMPPQMHVQPPVAGARPIFAPHPPVGPPRGPVVSFPAAESFEQKLARALGPPPS